MKVVQVEYYNQEVGDECSGGPYLRWMNTSRRGGCSCVRLVLSCGTCCVLTLRVVWNFRVVDSGALSILSNVSDLLHGNIKGVKGVLLSGSVDKNSILSGVLHRCW